MFAPPKPRAGYVAVKAGETPALPTKTAGDMSAVKSARRRRYSPKRRARCPLWSRRDAGATRQNDGRDVRREAGETPAL